MMRDRGERYERAPKQDTFFQPEDLENGTIEVFSRFACARRGLVFARLPDTGRFAIITVALDERGHATEILGVIRMSPPQTDQFVTAAVTAYDRFWGNDGPAT